MVVAREDWKGWNSVLYRQSGHLFLSVRSVNAKSERSHNSGGSYINRSRRVLEAWLLAVDCNGLPENFTDAAIDS